MITDKTQVINSFVGATSKYAVSIILVGSHASGQARSESDIDLIVIAKGKQEAEKALNLSKKIGFEKDRPVLDCKVYTEGEFREAKAGIDNRFLWTCMKNGKLLFGEDLTKSVRLLPKRVVEEYWDCVQSAEQACSNLESYVQFTGSCFHLYRALSITYFLDAFILHIDNQKGAKEDYIASVLGADFSGIRNRYYWVMNHIDPGLSPRSIRIPTNLDKSINKDDYERAHEKASEILETVKDRYRLVTHWAENQM
jgi:hypothetical protein